MIESFLITIVVYNQQVHLTSSYLSLIQNLETISGQLTILVYDNSYTPQTVPLINKNVKIHYIHNSKNGGISIAYNEGAALAEKINKKWLLFIDQDSVFRLDFFQTLIKSIEQNPTVHIFAPVLKSKNIIISPCWVILEKGFMMKNPCYGVQSLKYKSFINSGLCVSLNAFKSVGGYNNRIKLDFSDHYFINRLRTQYEKICVIEQVVTHSLSTFSDSYKSQLSRFRYYCNGARNFSNYTNFLSLFIICSFRAIKLSILSKDIAFLKVYFQYYIFGAPI